MEDNLIVVGKIVKPHGMKGEVVVEPLTDFPAERFKAGKEFTTVESVEFARLTVVRVRAHEERLLVDIKELTGRDEAEKLRDVRLAISSDETFSLPDGEYYGYQLLGLSVFNSEGEKIGRLKDFTTGSSPLLVIENPELGLVDYPAVDSLIKDIDLEDNKIVLDLPRGWRKLARDSGG